MKFFPFFEFIIVEQILNLSILNLIFDNSLLKFENINFQM